MLSMFHRSDCLAATGNLGFGVEEPEKLTDLRGLPEFRAENAWDFSVGGAEILSGFIIKLLT